MRITHSSITRNYLRRLNTNMSNLSKSNERMSSQCKFNSASENVADANKAMRVRLQLANNADSQNNVRDAEGKLSVVEDNLQAINKITQDVIGRTVQGMNGTMSAEENEKIAREIKNLQDEVLQISNTRYGDQYIFGAAGNADGSAPYSVDAGGDLMFNGTKVDSMRSGTGANAGKIVTMVPDPANPLLQIEKPIPYNGKNYLDIGLGITIDANGNLDPKTAVEYSVSGVELLGFGLTDKGTPNNLYGLLGEIAQNLTNGNTDALGDNLKEVSKQADKLLMGLSDIGTRMSFIEETGERLENNTFSLQKIQNDLEAVPIQEESIYNKDFEMSWMVTLQMGAKIIPPSIFDFMR